eukprot:5097635-Pyramimonas_sp.AAC.1
MSRLPGPNQEKKVLQQTLHLPSLQRRPKSPDDAPQARVKARTSARKPSARALKNLATPLASRAA